MHQRFPPREILTVAPDEERHLRKALQADPDLDGPVEPVRVLGKSKLGVDGALCR